jgi:putative holliday junction resolvase
VRYLGLDVGDARIGVAVSDETATIASGLPTVERRGPRKDVRTVVGLVREVRASEVVVGLPRRLNGEVGVQGQKVLAFMDALRDALDVPVVPWDERFTTALAQQTLIEADVKRKARKGAVDKVAAILILQNYLDYRKLADAEGHEPAD